MDMSCSIHRTHKYVAYKSDLTSLKQYAKLYGQAWADLGALFMLEH